MNRKNFRLYLISKTWRRDTYDLFDYETNNFIKQSFEIKDAGYVFRKNNQTIDVITEENNQSVKKIIFQLEFDKCTKKKILNFFELLEY